MSWMVWHERTPQLDSSHLATSQSLCGREAASLEKVPGHTITYQAGMFVKRNFIVVSKRRFWSIHSKN